MLWNTEDIMATTGTNLEQASAERGNSGAASIQVLDQVNATIKIISKVVSKGSGPAGQIIGGSLLIIAFAARLFSSIDNERFITMNFTSTDFAIVALIALLLFWSGSAINFYAYREALKDRRLEDAFQRAQEETAKEAGAKRAEKLQKIPKL
jgi:hypothetical protein